MNKTAHSEYDHLQEVYLMPPQLAFRSQKNIKVHWKALHFTYEPEYLKILDEFDYFEELIRKSGCEVRYFSEASGLDDLFCRDASISTDFGLVLCNMGKPSRSAEPKLHGRTYKALNEKILGQINQSGLLEGGDVAWLNQKTLAVGQGYRSNSDGLAQLKTLLSPFGIQLIPVELPHFKGPQDVFHLMSIFSPVDKDLAVVYSPLMPVGFRNYLLDIGFELVEVPENEFETMGCNVLAIAPRQCVMVAGNPITRELLTHHGCEVYEYSGSHLSIPGGGGPTCLTRPRWRIKKR